jgi:hypothetical protein
MIRKFMASSRILRNQTKCPIRKGNEGQAGEFRVRELLLFRGLAWPAARVSTANPFPVSGLPASAISGRKPLVIDTGGSGRAYEIETAEAWWRDLAEVRIDDERRWFPSCSAVEIRLASSSRASRSPPTHGSI